MQHLAVNRYSNVNAPMTYATPMAHRNQIIGAPTKPRANLQLVVAQGIGIAETLDEPQTEPDGKAARLILWLQRAVSARGISGDGWTSRHGHVHRNA